MAVHPETMRGSLHAVRGFESRLGAVLILALLYTLGICGCNNAQIEPKRTTGTSADYFVLRSGEALEVGDAESGLSLARRALREDSTSAGAMFLLGEALQQLGRLEEAEAAYRRVNDLDPTYPNVWLRLGNLAFEAGRPRLAAQHYRRELAVQRTSVVWYNLGATYVNLGEPDSARLALASALRLNPHHALSYIALSDLNEFEGDVAQAIADAERAVELDPANPVVRKHLGLLYLRAARTESAVEVLEEVTRENLLDSEAHYGLGQAYQRLGLPEEAARSFARQERAKQAMAAMDALRKRIAEEPSDHGAIRRLAHLSLAAERYGEAARLYRAILESQPDDLAIRTQLGTVLAIQGNVSGAEQQYRYVLERDPERGSVWMYLGTMLVRNGRETEGQEALSRAVELDPNLRSRVDRLRDRNEG